MLLLVDGSNLLFQMFYGMPARILSPGGKPIQGTLGFVGALLKIIRMVRPTHVAVLFDGEHDNPRAALDENYKANREDYSAMAEEDTPFSQLPDIYAALDLLGIAHGETETCEADDWMASFAQTYGKSMPVVLASQDSDLFQLVTENVRVLRYRGEKTVLCDEAYLQEKFGIRPSQYADFKALVGDHSDNIRGIRGIGPKTAAGLLTRFGSLEEILKAGDKIARPSLREALQTEAERVRRNRELISLTDEAAQPFELPQMVYADAGMTTTQVLQQLNLR